MASIPCDETVEVTQIELSLKTTFKSFMMVESLALLFQTVQAKWDDRNLFNDISVADRKWNINIGSVHIHARKCIILMSDWRLIYRIIQ